MTTRRRDFLAGAALVLLGSHTHAGVGATPAASRRGSALGRSTLAVLSRACDLLLPGAASAGIAEFVDGQLARPAREQVLLIKYLLPGPYRDFYLAGLGGLEAASLARLRRPFAHAAATDAQRLLEDLRQNRLPTWNGPPQPLLHFVLRNDALDVVYGTRAGFNRLGVPYMAHIEPPTDWPT